MLNFLNFNHGQNNDHMYLGHYRLHIFTLRPITNTGKNCSHYGIAIHSNMLLMGISEDCRVPEKVYD